jgi:hypothetical protein
MKKILGVYSTPQQHWVGDGFPVRSLFSYSSHGEHVSPFLLLDYAGPMKFEPAERPRGVGEHPHRGFETPSPMIRSLWTMTHPTIGLGLTQPIPRRASSIALRIKISSVA